MNKYLRYFLLVIFFLSAAARDVVSRIVLDYLGPLRLSAVTALIAVITCLLISTLQNRVRNGRPKNQWDRSKILRLAALSLTTALAVYFSNLSIQQVGPVTFKIVEVTTYPSWVALFMFLFLRQAAPKKDLIATAIALVGFFIFYADRFEQFQVQWAGIFASIGAALFYAASLVLAKGLLAQNLHPASLVAGRFMLLGTLALFASPVDLVQLPAHILWYLVGLGAVGYAILFTYMFYLIKEIQPSTMAVFIAGTPIFSATLTWLMIPGTTYSWLEMLGMGIIVAGLLVAVFIDEEKLHPAPAAVEP